MEDRAGRDVRMPVRTVGYVAEVRRDGVREGVSASGIVVSCPAPRVDWGLRGCCDSMHVPTLNMCPSIRVLYSSENIIAVRTLAVV